MAQGYYGTDSNPLAELHSERKVITPQTSGGSLEEGRYRLRTDLDSGDRIATYEINVGNGVEEVPVFPVSDSTTNVEKYRQVFISGEGWGFVPLADDNNYRVTFPQLKLYNSGTWYSWHDQAAAFQSTEADDKLIHRWVLGTLGDGTAEDNIGTADGTNNGVASVSGSWIGGAAGEGDGSSDYIETTSWGSFGSSVFGTDWAIALSIQHSATPSDINEAIGVFDGDNTNQSIGVEMGPVINDFGAGELGFNIRDNSGNDERVFTDGNRYDDGSPYRVVCNKTANNASGMEIWVNQSEITVTTERSQGFTASGLSDFGVPVGLFANIRGDETAPENYWDGIIDDICVFNDSLTQSEIQSYTNPWS